MTRSAAEVPIAVEIAPEPRATIAPFASVWPPTKFRMDTVGKGAPNGYATRKPDPCVFVTVKLNDTACACGGMLHIPAIWKFRSTAGGMIPPPPTLRVSARRHGAIAKNGSAGGLDVRAVRAAAAPPSAFRVCPGGTQNGGAAQFPGDSSGAR